MIPILEAVDAEAPLTECALKVDTSIPATSSSFFNHLAIVLEVTALCGLMVAINNFVSAALNGSVRATYALRVVTGQIKLFSEKKKGFIVFPCRDCFANALGKILTPSGLK